MKVEYNGLYTQFIFSTFLRATASQIDTEREKKSLEITTLQGFILTQSFSGSLPHEKCIDRKMISRSLVLYKHPSYKDSENDQSR